MKHIDLIARCIRRRLAASVILWLTLLSVARIALIPNVFQSRSRSKLVNSSSSLKHTDSAATALRNGATALACEQRLLLKDLSSELKIPRVIHFTAKSELMLHSYKHYLTLWYNSYSNFTFYLWRDVDAACLMRLHYPELLADFENELKTPLERSDFIRALAIYHFGGLYVDLDTVPVRSMAHLFDRPLSGAMIAREPEEHAVFLYNLDSLLSNAVMFGVPRHPFYYYYACKMFAEIRQLTPSQDRNDFHATHITGPILMNRVYENYTQLGLCPQQQRNCSVHLFRPDEFSPNYDTSQRAGIRLTCIRRYRTLDSRRRRLCNGLLYRQFAHRRLTVQTLAVHEFRHFSTRRQEASAVGAKGRDQKQTQCFNALSVIPTLKLYNSTEEQC